MNQCHEPDGMMSVGVKSSAEAATVRLSVSEATATAEHALVRIGFSLPESRVIAAHLLDAALCGYTFAGLPRILTIAEDPRTRQGRTPVCIVRETPVSALVDGGNYVGYYAIHRAAEIAIEKAQQSRFALVGVHNCHLSGRGAYYLEMIARAGFVGIHAASAPPIVVPLGGKRPALGTNPIAFAVPGDPNPFIFDMGTAAIMRGEVILRSRTGEKLPDGVAVDREGNQTTDPAAALLGGILPFGGHKGYGLSCMMQAICLLAGTAMPRGRVQDYGFLFVVFDPGLLIPLEQFKEQLETLLSIIKATPRQSGVSDIRISSERAFAERDKRRKEGIVLDQGVYEAIKAL
jgi:LDH2 family malate/lactate/ureidoglycolate dehydrogenase